MAHYDDGQVTFLLGDVRDVLREMPAESDPDTIQSLCIEVDPFHRVADVVRAYCAAYVPSAKGCTRMAAFGLYRSQRYGVVSVSRLDSQIGTQRNECGVCLHVGSCPRKHRSSIRGLRLFNTTTTAKALHEQIDRFRSDLANGNALGVDGRRRVTPYTHGVGTAFHTDGSVRIDDPGKVSKERFFHA